MPKSLFRGLVALTLCVYAVMLGWTLPAIAQAAGGLLPFDMRPGGYSFADAHTFLAALPAEGLDLYRNVQQRLDLLFPALLGATLFISIARLVPAGWGPARWLAAATAIPVAAFDYIENHAIAALLDAGAGGLTAALVAEASFWTVLKSQATTLAMSILLIALAGRCVATLFHRRAAA